MATTLDLLFLRVASLERRVLDLELRVPTSTSSPPTEPALAEEVLDERGAWITVENPLKENALGDAVSVVEITTEGIQAASAPLTPSEAITPATTTAIEPEVIKEEVEVASPKPGLPRSVQPTPPPLPPITRSRDVAAMLSAERLPPAPIEYQKHTPQKPAPANTLERTLGLKWAGWLGALILVIGAGLGLKYAYDQGWLGGLPAWARMVLWSFGAFSLIGAGEYTYRKINRLASTGLFAAGVASLFLVAYAGHAYYSLYSSSTAFIFTIIATLIGSAIAARTNLVSVAVLSLVGAHTAPIVLGGNASLTGFISYLIALQVVALALAGKNPTARWWILRGLSLAAAALWTLQICTNLGEMPWQVPVFALVTAILAHSEIIISAFRTSSRDTLADAPTPASKFYLIFAALLPAVAAYHYFPTYSMPLLTWLAGASVVLAVWAIACRRLAASMPTFKVLDDIHRFQAALLLGGALTLGLPTDYRQTLVPALAVLGAAWCAFRPSHGSGRITYSPLFVVYALGLAIEQPTRETLNTLDTISQLSQFQWFTPAVYGLFVGLAAQLSALLLSRPTTATKNKSLESLPTVLSVIATLACIGFGITATTGFVSTFILLGLAWVMSLLALKPTWTKSLFVTEQTFVLFGAAAFKWLFFDTIGTHLNHQATLATTTLLFNPETLTGLALGASLIGQMVLSRRRTPASDVPAELPLLPFTLATIILYIIGALEVDRAVAMLSVSTDHPLGFDTDFLRCLLLSLWSTIALIGYTLFFNRIRQHPVDRYQRYAGVLAQLMLFLAVIGGTLSLLSFVRLTEVTPFANIVFLTASIISAASMYFTYLLRRRPDGLAGQASDTLAVLCAVAATLIIIISGSVELTRIAFQFPSLLGGIPAGFAVPMLVTIWSVTAITTLWTLIRRWGRDLAFYPTLASLALKTTLFVAGQSILTTLLFPWMAGMARRGFPIGNLQLFTAAVSLGSLLWANHLRKTEPAVVRPSAAKLLRLTAIICGLISFFASTIEIARIASLLAIRFGFATELLLTTSYSVWWAIFALGCIAVGFKARLSALRYIGLGLFAITATKVVFFDLAAAGQGWRILSFIGLGALLITTSVLYGKLAPILLKDELGKQENA